MERLERLAAAGGAAESSESVPRHLVEELQAALAYVAEHDELAIGTFSAEELAVVTPAGAGGRRLVALEPVEQLDAAGQRAARAAAARGLAARGLLSVEQVEPAEAAALPLTALTGLLGLVAWLRRAPDALAWVDRSWGHDQRHRYLYGISDLALLDEAVGPEGLHRFVVRTRPAALEAVAAFVDPEGWAVRDRGPLVKAGDVEPEGWGDVEQALGGAEGVSQLVALQRSSQGGQRLHVSVAASPAGVWAAGGGAPPPEEVAAGAEAQVGAREVDADSLRSLVAAALRFDVVAPLAEASDDG